ncbi:hypothetical protein [Leifsonia tongyongensis]|uniref:hypothetical protein n=1 Tax=Leifsonia tongyongensis TaxID=1268043 RepID=UPI001878C126|nr:hypothetical protein [Diaminobutyricibacter tongyongensis]
MDPAPTTPHRSRSGGPHLGVLAIVSTALVVVGLIVAALTGGQPYISPFAGADAVSAYAQQNWPSIRVTSMIQFGSAVPLGIYAATAYARLLRLGVRVPGPGIGFFGGITASILLMVSALGSYVVSRPDVSSDPTVALALTYFAFITGGVGFVTGMGLLVAGIAVPSLILHFVPRWLAWTGLVIAALAELSFLSMAIEPLQFILPIGRFGGLLWLIAVGFLLPNDRREVRREGTVREDDAATARAEADLS